jgi:hypothetical protein
MASRLTDRLMDMADVARWIDDAEMRAVDQKWANSCLPRRKRSSWLAPCAFAPQNKSGAPLRERDLP